MAVRRRNRASFTSLIRFDHPYLERHGCVAGVDEAGRGPLAGPVVAAAVILPSAFKLQGLADSKLLNPSQRSRLFDEITAIAVAVGVGIVGRRDIDAMNIHQASFHAMRQALTQLSITPAHILVDGFRIPSVTLSQTGIIAGDAQSAHIAAASIIAKVTRDRLMEELDQQFPGYGFKQHKGYSTRQHLVALNRLGPCEEHRRSFAPVRIVLEGGKAVWDETRN